jgi:hypothetical protein
MWLRLFPAGAGFTSRGCNPYRLRDYSAFCGSDKQMLTVVVGIVTTIGVPGAGEELRLPGDGAALYVNAVDKTVFDGGVTPVAAPDEPTGVRKLSKEREVSLP